MLFACAVVAVCAATNAVVSAVAPPPLPPKIYYLPENAETYFREHIKIHNRKYDAVEYIKRLEIFKTNLLEVNSLNNMYPRTVFALTKFSDLTNEEREIYNSCMHYNETIDGEAHTVELLVGKMDAPDTFDWRDHGVVAPVKDQGMCVASHIFSAIGNIEGQYAIKHNTCIPFSEQMVVDCLKGPNCDGGSALTVMQKLSERHGCMKEEDYPFIDMENQTCKEDAKKVVAKVTGAVKLNIKDEKTLKQKLYEIGPLVVGLYPNDLWFYGGGVLKPRFCKNSDIRCTHLVLLVGYGEENGEKYWILKDAYGVGAFENGYVRLQRGVNACGVEAVYHATAQVA